MKLEIKHYILLNCYDYVWKSLSKQTNDRDESEICFVGNIGMDILNKSIDTIYIAGELFDVSEKEQAIEILS